MILTLGQQDVDFLFEKKIREVHGKYVSDRNCTKCK